MGIGVSHHVAAVMASPATAIMVSPTAITVSPTAAAATAPVQPLLPPPPCRVNTAGARDASHLSSVLRHREEEEHRGWRGPRGAAIGGREGPDYWREARGCCRRERRVLRRTMLDTAPPSKKPALLSPPLTIRGWHLRPCRCRVRQALEAAPPPSLDCTRGRAPAQSGRP
jgi:hypothetical protein